jgi:hypothetical protein
MDSTLTRQHFTAIERDRFGREPEPDEADVEYAERRAAARALRAIPSEARSEQSRANGRRGGRPRVVLYRVAKGIGTWQDVCTLAEARRMARSYVADGWPAEIRRLVDDAHISIR